MNKLVVFLYVGLATMGAWAGPVAIPYQGVLSEVVNGHVVPITSKTATLEVRLYDVASGGTMLWGREVAVTLDEGAFNMELNDTVGSSLGGGTLESVVCNATGSLYIGLKVKGGEEIVPRQRLLSSAFAIAARNANESAGDFKVSNNLTVQKNANINGTLTANDATNINGILTVKGNVLVTAPATISGYGTIPIGGIIMWSGAENQIPDGWALCNGATVNARQTPDLRGRFVVGAGTGSDYSVGNVGGANTVTLTVAQMPKHTHGHLMHWSQPDWGRNDGAWPVWTGERSVQSGEAGGDQPHENRPPYYALCYIMRVK